MSNRTETCIMILGFLVFFVAMLFAGTCDYNDAKNAEAQHLANAQKDAIVSSHSK